jgi:hypothetical protein
VYQPAGTDGVVGAVAGVAGVVCCAVAPVAPVAPQLEVVDEDVDSGAVPHPAGSLGEVTAAGELLEVSRLDVVDAA